MTTARHWTEMKRIWFAVWLFDLLFWFSLPARIGDSHMSLIIHEHSGTPGGITVVVKDDHQRPMPGISVVSCSFSGTTSAHETDSGGVTVIRPGESEVLNVRIAGHGFDFENHLPGGGLLGDIPHCDNGLTIHVTMHNTP